MTNPQNPNPNSEPILHPRRRLRRVLLWGGVGGGITLLAAGIGAAWFIRYRLAPVVGATLETILARPVDVGPVERFTFNSIRFGKSTIPPTAQDKDEAFAEAVEVNFALLSLFQPKVQLDITLIKPTVYIQEDQPGNWVNTQLNLDPDPAFTLVFRTIGIENATINLMPYEILTAPPPKPRRPISINVDQVRADLTEDNERLQADLTGKFAQGGTFAVKGEALLAEGKVNAQVRTNRLFIPQLDWLIPTPDFSLQRGELNANLNIRLEDWKPLDVRGTASLNQVKAQVQNLPNPVNLNQAQFRFAGTQFIIDQFNTTVGDLALNLKGTILSNSDLDFNKTRFNLAANLQPTQVSTLLKTVEAVQGEPVNLPFPVTGEVQATVNLVGNLLTPEITGSIAVTEPTLIDRVVFNTLQTDFEVAAKFSENLEIVADPEIEFSNLLIAPATGGRIQGNGEIQLKGFLASIEEPEQKVQPKRNNNNQELPKLNVPTPEPIPNPRQEFDPVIRLDLDVDNVALDAIAQSYGLLPQFQLGSLSAEAQVSGTLNNLKGEAEFSLPAATYPILGTAEFLGNQAQAQVNIADGDINIVAQQRNNETWNTQINADQIAIQPLVNIGLLFADLPNETKAQIQSVDLAGGRLNLDGQFAGSLEDFSIDTITGDTRLTVSLPQGTLNAAAQLQQGDFQTNFNTNNLSLPTLIDLGLPLANLPPELASDLQNLDFRQGTLQLTGSLAGNLEEVAANTLTGTARTVIDLGNIGGTVTADTQFIQGQFQTDFDVNSVQINPLLDIGFSVANLPDNLQNSIQNLDLRNSSLTADGSVIGNLENLNLSNLTVNADGQIDLGNLGGTINAQGQLQNNQFQAQVGTRGIALEPLINVGLPVADLQPSLEREIQALNLQGGFLQGDLNLAGNLANLSAETLISRVNGQVNLGREGGIVQARGETNGGRWRASILGDEIALTRFSPLVESQVPELIARLNEQGLINQADNLPLLRGLLNTEISGMGSLGNLNPNTIRAMGELRLTELPIIQEPFEAIASWNGRQINIQKAETDSFSANGLIGVEFAGTGVPELSNLDLNVRVSNFNLQSPVAQRLLALLPPEITTGDTPLVAGLANFNGQLTGSLATLQLQGNLRLDNFAVRAVTFDPVLAGTVDVRPGQQVSVNLAGEQDKIEFALNEQYLPVSFLIQQDDSRLVGTTEGNTLLVNLEDFPLQTLSLAPLADAGIGTLKGLASGEVQVSNLASFNINEIGVRGNVTVSDPALGYIQGDLFAGNLRFSDGIAQLTNARLLQNETELLITAQANINEILASLSAPPTAEGATIPPQFQGSIAIPRGSLQDVLTTFQWFKLDDFSRGLNTPNYATATEVKPVPVGLPPNATLLEQLQRFEEIKAILQASIEAELNEPLPPLEDLDGRFTGQIAFQGSIQSGAEATATINGQDWTWGEYIANQFLLEASLTDNLLRVEPIQLRSGTALYDFRGQLNLADRRASGQFRAKDIQLAEIERLADIPNVDLTGQLNLQATLAGTLENPQATGELTILNGTVNEEPIQQADTSFNYNNSRLRFGGSLLVTEQNPIQFRGTLPYQLPFATVRPESNIVDVRVDIIDEGLKVVNLISSDFDLEEVKGLAQLRIGGTLQQTEGGQVQLSLQPEGLLKIQSAVINAENLEESIVGLNGNVIFTGDRIIVEQIQGDLVGERGTGTIVLAGVLPFDRPLAETDPALNNPLQLALTNLIVDVPDLYRGNVSGGVIIRGTALKPRVGGEVILSEGRVILPSEGTATLATETAETNDQPPIDVNLNGLKITLADNVQVISEPILNAPLINFTATGTITLNGAIASIEDIQPQGTIELTGGQVNLYTSQLRLDRGYPQRAIFVPSQGLDPILDVRLVTRVPEAIRFVSTPSAFPSAEQTEALSPSRFGTVRTIRIAAIVRGPASEINDIIRLQSSPPRSQNELVALLGGSVIQGIQDDSTLVIANIASAGLFNRIQQDIINATGLTEFRIFPTRIAERGSSGRASALGLGIEVGLDVTNNTYVSLSRVLASNQPFLFNINYRVNDNLLLRGATNFGNESEIRFEYETRF